MTSTFLRLSTDRFYNGLRSIAHAEQPGLVGADVPGDDVGRRPWRVDFVCAAIHSAYMRKDAAITVRIPADLKRRLEGSARRARRSLSAEIAHRLESSVTPDDPEK